MVSEGGTIDILTLSHFINYFIAGLYFKDRYCLVLVIGVLWEVLEYYIVHNSYTRKLILKYWPIPIRKWEDKWNKLFDLISNMIGYYVGNNIHKYI